MSGAAWLIYAGPGVRGGGNLEEEQSRTGSPSPNGSAQPDETDRRRMPRYKLRAPARIKWEEGACLGYSLDISHCGILLDVVGEMPGIGDICTIRLEMPGGNLVVSARVVRIHRPRGCVAFEIEQVHSDGRTLLEALIASGSI